ncbi:hypothetical protein IB274_03320 [Pseudomonas sp. PDM18]|nr:hypothetical protein [Pseudomonas sp. PDM18]
MPQRLSISLLAMLTSLSGCAKDQSLAPPPDSEQVTVRIKVPAELKAETMEVMYRSTLCTFTDHSAYGEPYQRDGYQQMDIQPSRQGQSDIYEAKLPKDGGSECQWRLSNVTFGVSYLTPEHFGQGLTSGSGGGVVVIFDDNASPRGGARIEVDGNLKIKKPYYPWIDEAFLGGHKKKLHLSNEGLSYLKYNAPNAQEIYFEPILYSSFVVYSEGPKIKEKGSYTKFTYPDGSILENGDFEPRLQKLEAIRLAAEKSKQP